MSEPGRSALQGRRSFHFGQYPVDTVGPFGYGAQQGLEAWGGAGELLKIHHVTKTRRRIPGQPRYCPKRTSAPAPALSQTSTEFTSSLGPLVFFVWSTCFRPVQDPEASQTPLAISEQQPYDDGVGSGQGDVERGEEVAA